MQKQLFAVGAGTVLAAIACAALLFIVFSGPSVAYRLYSPSANLECSSIRTGMTKQQVFVFVHRRTAPYFEDSFEPNHFSFSRPGGTCTVTFDSQTGSVVGSAFTPQTWADGSTIREIE